MADDPGSLSHLFDLAVPPPIAYWPPAPGVWILAIGAVGIIAIILRRAFVRYRADAYRRVAIAELDRIAADIDSGNAGIIERASIVLKRVALVAFARETVASLSGAAWADFLDRTAGTGVDKQIVTRPLMQIYANGSSLETDDLRAFIKQARIWVRSHRRQADFGER